MWRSAAIDLLQLDDSHNFAQYRYAFKFARNTTGSHCFITCETDAQAHVAAVIVADADQAYSRCLRPVSHTKAILSLLDLLERFPWHGLDPFRPPSLKNRIAPDEGNKNLHSRSAELIGLKFRINIGC